MIKDKIEKGLISVIVPVYNTEKYVRKCIDSIIKQKYKKIEVIIINDGSTDNSLEICQKFQKFDDRIRIISQNNHGISSVRNLGIKKASGEYISFIDSDDYIHPLMFEKLIELLEKYEADIAITGRYRNINNKIDFDFLNLNHSHVHVYNNLEAVEHLFLETKYIKPAVWDKLYKAKLFEHNRFPDYALFEDAALTYKLLFLSSKIVATENQYYIYNIHSNSLITSNWNAVKTTCYKDITTEIYEYFKNIKLQALSQDALYWKMQFGVEAMERIYNSKLYENRNVMELTYYLKKYLSMLEISKLNISRSKKIKKYIEFNMLIYCPRVLFVVKNKRFPN